MSISIIIQQIIPVVSIDSKKVKRAEYHKQYNKQYREKNREKWAENREKRVEYLKQYRKKNHEKIRAREYRKQYRKKNHEKIREKIKQYREKNQEKIREKIKQYREKNQEKLTEYIKQYREKNQEKLTEYDKQYREKNRERFKQYIKQYREKNREKNREQIKQRFETDPLYKAKHALRAAVSSAFKRIKRNKPTRTEQLLGCSWIEAKAHFERLFQEGMSWENHGEWHIDHIRPVASFNKDELHLMNHISNLQPLWAEDNTGSKRVSDQIKWSL